MAVDHDKVARGLFLGETSGATVKVSSLDNTDRVHRVVESLGNPKRVSLASLVSFLLNQRFRCNRNENGETCGLSVGCLSIGYRMIKTGKGLKAITSAMSIREAERRR